MFDPIEICWKCEYDAPTVVLQRCNKCLVLGCQHERKDSLCTGNLKWCQEREMKKVLRAWRDELNSMGVCVGYTYRLDECCQRLERTDDGEWACEHCGKRVGKVPLPNSCAGCGGHSVDPDCPLHGRD